MTCVSLSIFLNTVQRAVEPPCAPLWKLCKFTIKSRQCYPWIVVYLNLMSVLCQKAFMNLQQLFFKHGFDSHPFEQCKTRPTEIYLYDVLFPARSLAELQLILVPPLPIISLNRCYNMISATINKYLMIIISTTTIIILLKSALCLHPI